MAFRGIDIRETGDRLLFRVLLQDSNGDEVTTGTTSLYLYELQNDGTLLSYDWNDNTFKATALTTETQAMTHRQGNNSTTDTGLWTYALTTLTGFTAGNVYFARVVNTNAAPNNQIREFQFGSGVLADIISVLGSGTAASTMLLNLLAVYVGTCTSDGTVTSLIDTGLPANADHFNGRTIIFTSGTLNRQGTQISDMDASGNVVIVQVTTAPLTGQTYVVI